MTGEGVNRSEHEGKDIRWLSRTPVDMLDRRKHLRLSSWHEYRVV